MIFEYDWKYKLFRWLESKFHDEEKIDVSFGSMVHRFEQDPEFWINQSFQSLYEEAVGKEMIDD